jgi:hypothetical protein
VEPAIAITTAFRDSAGLTSTGPFSPVRRLH